MCLFCLCFPSQQQFFELLVNVCRRFLANHRGFAAVFGALEIIDVGVANPSWDSKALANRNRPLNILSAKKWESD